MTSILPENDNLSRGLPHEFLTNIDNLPAPAERVSRRIRPLRVSALSATPEAQSLETVRSGLVQRMHDYADTPKTRDVLLIAAPAGVGKSMYGIEFVQDRARKGERWYWAAANHAMWDDLSAQPGFDHSLWYHWQPMSGEINGGPACQFPAAQEQYTSKGYRAYNLCRHLCGHTQYDPVRTFMDVCPFRCQNQVQSPVTMIMHQHLFTGLDDAAADGIVIDETFVGLVAKRRHIDANHIIQTRVGGRISELAKDLFDIASEISGGYRKPQNGKVSGKALLDIIGEIYPDVVVQLENLEAFDEKQYTNPRIAHESDIKNLEEIYMTDLLAALEPEYRAWRAGLEVWAERVWVDKTGLTFIQSSQLWDRLPRKVIILDATGQPDFYKAIFQRNVTDYRPVIQRKGKIYQVGGRVYSKSMLKPGEGESASDTTRDFIAVAKEIIAQRGYKDVGIITQMLAKKAVKNAFPNLDNDHLMHFYALRGLNGMKRADAVFIFGTPSPAPDVISDIVLALDPKRTRPVFDIDPDTGKPKPLALPIPREYRFTPAGLAQMREEFGAQDYNGADRVVWHYPDPLLAAIQAQLRESELVQAIYRARLIDNPADVWIFSSVPTPEPIDGIWQDPPIGPPGIAWSMWLKISAFLKTLPIDAVVSVADIAAATGLDSKNLANISIIDQIHDYDSARYEVVKGWPKGGRKPSKLLKVLLKT